VEYLLARYAEAGPDHTDPELNELRDQITAVECHLVYGIDEPYGGGVTVSNAAWVVLRLHGFEYRDRSDFRDEWRLPTDPKAPPTT
jgi:hypothetical protein